jgi:hypothetical protein
MLSGIAGYYSIVGLALIFPGAFWPVVIMGGALEFSKLVTASWLYRNWKNIPFLLKTYLTLAVVILMLITSMGIFGFLSKAHIEHSVESAPLYDKVALFDEQINMKKQQIEDNKKSIRQMDESVDQLIGRTTDALGVNRAVRVKKSQAKERKRLTDDNIMLQQEIGVLNEQKTPILADMRKTEADIGPIKYVAELVYGKSDADIVDKAVRLVILIIMMVFDPLAVLLLIAGNISLGVRSELNEKIYVDEIVTPQKTRKTSNRKKKRVRTEVEEISPTLFKEDEIQIKKGNIAEIPDTSITETQLGDGIYITEKKEK